MIQKLGALGLGLCLVSCLPSGLFASAAAGASAAPYLKLPMGARATGMGEAFTGIANDTEALYYNPAGITQIDATSASFMQIVGFGGINYSHLALAAPAENFGIDVWGTIGFSYTLISVDDILRTKALPDGSYDAAYAQNGYTFTSGGTVVDVAYAWQATKMFSLGANMKFINEKVDDFNGWGAALDLGLFTKPNMIPGVSAGMVITNLGLSPDTGASLPVGLRVGAGYNWDHPFTPSFAPNDLLNIAMDVVLPIVPIDGSVHFNGGLEYTRFFGFQNVSARLGYRFPSDLGALAGLAAGLGYGLDFGGATVSLDYAFVPYGDLGVSQRIALSGAFGGKPRPTPTPDVKPPSGMQGIPGDRSVTLYWRPNPERVKGYNVYQAYSLNGPWNKMTRQPIQTTGIRLGAYNATQYFAVTAISPRAPFLESNRSVAVMVTPKAGYASPAPARPAATAYPAARPAAAPAGRPAAGSSSRPASPPLPAARPAAAPPLPGPPPLP